jgi:hypothetical protein
VLVLSHLHRGLVVKTHHDECRKAVSPHSSCDCRQSPTSGAGCEPPGQLLREKHLFPPSSASHVPRVRLGACVQVAKNFPRREQGFGSANFCTRPASTFVGNSQSKGLPGLPRRGDARTDAACRGKSRSRHGDSGRLQSCGNTARLLCEVRKSQRREFNSGPGSPRRREFDRFSQKAKIPSGFGNRVASFAAPAESAHSSQFLRRPT